MTESSDQHPSKASRWQRQSLFVKAVGGIIVLLILVVIGVAVGVTVSRNHKSKNLATNSSPSSNPSSGGTSTTGQPTSTGVPNASNDPSVFAKDPNLHQSFYGVAYTPEGSQLPDCGNSLKDVITDIQLLSQLTTRIRLYGADCNQTALVLEAIKQTKVEMEIFAGIFVVPDDDASYTRQRDTLKEAIQTYGVDHIAGVTVGNEFMLNYLTDKGESDPNSPTGNEGATILINFIKDTRNMLADLSLSKNMPVGNSDAGSFFNTEVLSSVDYGLSNVHAWFANVSAEDAAGWVTSFFEDTNVKPAAQLPNNPKMYIAETGWPTKSSDVANESNGPGTASVAGLQTFLDTFICQANTNNIPYFFFEYFDETWKDIQFGGVEGWWGLFNADRTLKDVKIPDCASP